MQRLTNWIQGRYKAICLLLVLGGTAMYAVFSMKSLVWADEAYTFAMIRHSFPEIWNITAADVHPPLYYFLLKLLSAPFGYSLAISRMLSALPCVLILAVAAYQLPRLFGKQTAVLFLVLYLCYPFTMTYATETRMYSLAELFVFLNALYAYRCWKDDLKMDWALFALSGVCAAYTHYFALVSAGVIYLILLIASIRKKRELLKGWFLASAATVLLYLPWLGCFVSQLAYKVNNEYWIEPITIRTVLSYVKTIFSANGITLYPVFAGVAFIVAFVALLTSRDRKAISLTLCSLVVPLGTVAIGLAASVLVRPVFVIRYLLPSVPLAVFAFAYALGRMKNEQLFAALMTVALMGGCSNAAYTAKTALLPESNRISNSLLDSFPQCDAYVVLDGNTMHASQELSYYAPKTPVYTPDPLGPDNPYPNRIPLEEFRPADYSCILLVLEAGASIPDTFQNSFASEFLLCVDVSGSGQDLWYLTRTE